MPENLSGFQEGERNRDLQLVSGRNVVLNYGSGAFDRSSKLHTYLPISNNPVSILLCLRFYVIFCFGQSSHEDSSPPYLEYFKYLYLFMSEHTPFVVRNIFRLVTAPFRKFLQARRDMILH